MRAQPGLGKVEVSLGWSYHNSLRPWRVRHECGHAGEALFSPAPLRTRVAAAVFGLLSELRVPMLIVTRVFREELAWPLPTAFSPVLITSAPNFLPLYN